jgi:16S rRNA G966 N2-methylase RsmD
MARLASQANSGYVPLPVEAAALIATYIANVTDGQRVCDPCAGEGQAIGIIATALGILAEQVFCNEINDARARACTQHSAHVLSCDTLKSLQSTPNAFQMAYINPPFDSDGAEEGGGRLEPKFFRRIVEAGGWVQPGGLVVIVTPQDILARRESVNHLARWYSDLRIYRLPDAIRRYREAVLFGVVRTTLRLGDEHRHEARRISDTLNAELPVLEAQTAPVYALPAPLPLKRPLVWRDGSKVNPVQAQADVLETGGAWASKAYRTQRRRHSGNLPPLFPLHPAQAALRIAAGEINGAEIEMFGKPQLIKGSTVEEVQTTTEHDDTGDARITIRRTMRRRTPNVVTVDPDGSVRRYIGDAGMEALMHNPGVATKLLAAVEHAAPPRYRLDLDPAIAALLAELKPASGQTLPGYPLGLLPMQKHVVAALHRAITTIDPSSGVVPDAVIAAAEMGCGKSVKGIATAHLLEQTRRPRERAFTVILSAPNHLIGDKKTVAAWKQGKPVELPQWFEEWHDYLGSRWAIEILESPADLSAFFRAAQANPTTPRVGFISHSKLSLSCGMRAGVENFSAARWAQVHADRYADRAAEELAALEEHRKRASKRSQAELSATAGDDATAQPAPRWHARDALRRQHSLVRNGLCCVTCGRRVLDKRFEPTTEAALRKSGLAKARCEWCNEPLGQMAREQDNTADRGIDLFRRADWRNEFAHDATGNRLIPWGERPTSNPRYALGLLIRRRYAGLVDLYIADEAHECRGERTAIGRAFGAMVNASAKTVALTGTLFGGYSSDLYSLLLRLGNRPVLEAWGWNNLSQFVRDAGIVEEIQRQVIRADDAGHFNGQPSVSTRVEERPGITALLSAIVQNQAVQVLLSHMGFNLPDYDEDLVLLDMPDDIADAYRCLEQAVAPILRAGGHDALGSYLQATLSYPYQPWNPKPVASRRTGMTYMAEAFDPDRVLPHHAWLATYAAAQVRQGRRVLVYCEHTGRDDIMPDIVGKITDLAASEHGTQLTTAILRSTTVPSGERRAWFKQRAAEGVNVVLCNARLVKTGLNLIQWPSIVVLEPVYSFFNLFQAKKRALRPTQTAHCEVIHVGYAESMSQRAIALVAKKAAAAAILSGDDLSNGVMQVDAGMSLLQELANAVRNGEAMPMHADITALLKQGAKALKHRLEHSAEELLGVSSCLSSAESGSLAPATHDDAAIADALEHDSPAVLWRAIEVIARSKQPGRTTGDASQPIVAVQYAMF